MRVSTLEGFIMEKRGRGRPKKGKSLKEQAAEIKKLAEDAGLQTNFFFVTTFDRYLEQLAILDRLQSVIDKGDTLVEQVYVKGRSNTVINPAIRAYNSTTDSANKTATTLIRIINGFKEDEGESVDPLLSIINGGK